jgi:hypothetical protein
MVACLGAVPTSEQLACVAQLAEARVLNARIVAAVARSNDDWLSLVRLGRAATASPGGAAGAFAAWGVKAMHVPFDRRSVTEIAAWLEQPGWSCECPVCAAAAEAAAEGEGGGGGGGCGGAVVTGDGDGAGN